MFRSLSRFLDPSPDFFPPKTNGRGMAYRLTTLALSSDTKKDEPLKT